MQLRLVTLWCLVAAAAGSTLQDPFIHESRQDQMAVASSVSGSTLQDPFLHAHRQDQLAVASGVPGAKVVAPDTKKADRTPAARVPVPSLDDVIVLDGSEEEEEAGPEPPRPAVRPAPPSVAAPAPAPAAALPAWLRGALPASAASFPAWLRGAAPTVILLQPIFVPVPVPEGQAATRGPRPDYYGAADPARLRGFRRRRSPHL